MLQQAKVELLKRLATNGLFFYTTDPKTRAIREGRSIAFPASMAEVIASLVIVRFVETLITNLIAGGGHPRREPPLVRRLHEIWNTISKKKDKAVSEYDVASLDSYLQDPALRTMTIEARQVDMSLEAARAAVEEVLLNRANMPPAVSQRLSWELVSTIYDCCSTRIGGRSQWAQDHHVDLLIVAALEEERDALLKALSNCVRLDADQEDIRVYYRSRLKPLFPSGREGEYSVVMTSLSGMGRLEALNATADAIRKWQPRYVIMVGIAGGIAERGVAIGDVVIADQVVDYELQKIKEDNNEIRWQVYPADPRLLLAARHFVSDSWCSSLSRPERGRPRKHFGPIFSGDKVVADSNVLRSYIEHWPAAIAVEMEGAGIAMAASRASSRPGFFMVRGVSDLADNRKDTLEVGSWRSYACEAAAFFVVGLLLTGPIVSVS